MTWVTTLPALGVQSIRSTFWVYYRTKDNRVLLWHGGATEGAARKEAEKVLADDRKKRLYHFVSATIVETVTTESVVRSFEVSP